MAQYSEFGLRVHGARQDLLSQLVTRVVGVQVCGAIRCGPTWRAALLAAARTAATRATRADVRLLLPCDHTPIHPALVPAPPPSPPPPPRPALSQPGDENHAIALEFALQHAYYHSHGDPSPPAVAGFYQGCAGGPGPRRAPAACPRMALHGAGTGGAWRRMAPHVRARAPHARARAPAR